MAEGSTRRRDARERALGLLYEAEVKGVDPADVLGALPVRPDPYAVDLVEGVATQIATIDELISTHSPNWPLDRMPAIDRALLRQAIYELRGRPDVPTGVVLAEAVDLASQFSTDDSARFVNGVLAQIATEVRPDDPSRSVSGEQVLDSDSDR